MKFHLLAVLFKWNLILILYIDCITIPHNCMKVTQRTDIHQNVNNSTKTLDFKMKYKTEVKWFLLRSADTGNSNDTVLLARWYTLTHLVCFRSRRKRETGERANPRALQNKTMRQFLQIRMLQVRGPMSLRSWGGYSLPHQE